MNEERADPFTYADKPGRIAVDCRCGDGIEAPDSGFGGLLVTAWKEQHKCRKASG